MVDEFELIFNRQMYLAQNPTKTHVKNTGITKFISAQAKKKMKEDFDFTLGEQILCDSKTIDCYVDQLNIVENVKQEFIKKQKLHETVNDVRKKALK